MNKEKILQVCNMNKKGFIKIIKDIKYEKRGMFNSELLLVVSLIKELKLKQIIESGRARGHSTNVVTRFFEGTGSKITSIDFDKKSKDTTYSEKRLKKYQNLKLIYGDSNIIIPKIITKDCAIIIDGPKGEEAILLAVRLLKNKKVKLVFIHDLHRNTFHRNIFESLFKDYFFSDDLEFVNRFKDLDDNCWKILKGTGEAPYLRKGKRIHSYASTVGVIFNSRNPFLHPNIKNYLEYYNNNQATLRKCLIKKLRKNGLIYRSLSKIYTIFRGQFYEK